MYIKQLSIKNYRNFGNYEFKINLKPFNLVIGENNVGKTNLLNALGLIFSPDISFYQKRSLEVEDINFQTIREFKNRITHCENFDDIVFPDVKIEVVLTEFNLDQQAIVGDWLIKENDDVSSVGKSAKITYIYSPYRLGDLKKWFEDTKVEIAKIERFESETNEGFQNRKVDIIDFPIQCYGYSLYGGEDTTKQIDFVWLNFFKMEFLDALRDAKLHLLASGRNTLLYSILTAKTENGISDIKTHLIELRNLISKDDSIFSTIKKEIESYLKNISSEDEDGIIDFQFSGVETSDILKRLGLIYGSEPISIERNGLGRNNLLYISLLLSQLMKDADKKKVYFRLIGIEEPEAHLHPLLQVHLSRNIDTENTQEKQVIITSHSTHITSQLSLDDTVILYKDNKEIKPYYLLESLPKDSKKYLRKYLDATKSTLFFARKIILVEGISEQLVIPEFFKIHCGESLEKKNISVVNVQGISMKHFLEIIKAGYFIKCLVFTDSDDSTRATRLPTTQSELA